MAVFNIPAGVPFVDALAAGILRLYGEDPLRLASVRVLLPTRRACRTLRDAFLRATGGVPTLLPTMTPLGDVDEDELLLMSGAGDIPEAISPLRRQLLLTYLIAASDETDVLSQAAKLARDLARLQDQVDINQLDWSNLEGLVPSDLSEHWQTTLRFLDVMTSIWPTLLKEQDVVNPGARSNMLLSAQAEIWRQAPPSFPVIVAGSTGSIPATANLLKVVASLPNGSVVLPGLDMELTAEVIETLEESHPQFGMTSLLAKLGTEIADVLPWGLSPDLSQRAGASERFRLMSTALCPASEIGTWQTGPVSPGALDGFNLVECQTPQEEAGAIALAMREALETPGRTAALVTPDRALARRVAGELGRWGIKIDDSAGKFLSDTSVGVFLRLIVSAAFDGLSPMSLMSLLKHPLAAGGLPEGELASLARTFEVRVLRGPRPGPGIDGLRAVLTSKINDSKARVDHDLFLARLEALFAPLTELAAQPAVALGDLLRAHVRVGEAIAATDQVDGASRLWLGTDGDAAAAFISELAESSELFAEMDPGNYEPLMDVLMMQVTVRSNEETHPRLSILGPMEARLLHADLMILGGLNDGTWPSEPAVDPWMSRPMRERFGLPALERTIGQSAHDFVQAACAKEVIVTRSSRVDGVPTVRSRWLERLLTLVGDTRLVKKRDDLIGWQALLDRPAQVQPCSAPRPTPPVAARPRSLSVTQIEKLMRDPYEVYARHVLKLVALPRLDEDPGASQYGTVIHNALERYCREVERKTVRGTLPELLAIGETVFHETFPQPGIWAFWWPKFVRIAEWFIATQAARAGEISQTMVELKGELSIQAPGGEFTVNARADRIDVLKDNTLAIIDYKTGEPPTWSSIDQGKAPQLPLEALLARQGAFNGLAAADVSSLEFWWLKGNEDGGAVRSRKENLGEMATAALEGLRNVIEAFDQPETPYIVLGRSGKAASWNDYAHLEREAEWSV